MTGRSLLVVCVAVAVSSARAAEDPIGKKLADAKAAYQTNLENSRAAVRTWFDKREDAARKDGNKKAVDQIKAERLKYESAGELSKGAPPQLAKNFVEAQRAMEDAYAAAIKEYTRAKQDDLASAVEKQFEAFKRGGAGPAENPLGVEITPEILAAKFGGKATFDEKSGALELVYRFADKKELKDFELGDVEPKIASNAVVLAAGQKIKHVVQFDILSVTGVIALKEMKGAFLTTTGGTAAGVGGDGKDTLYMVPKGAPKSLYQIVPAKLRRGAIRFGVGITEKRATLYWGNEQLGGESTEPGAGQVLLHGGEAGYAFGSVVITGKPNRDWAKKFFAAKAEK